RQTGQYGMVIPKFVKNALLNHPITIFGDGKQTRCFCDVDDVTDGMIKLMNNKKAVGEIFNLGNDKSISIEELAHKIKKLTNSKSKIEYVAYAEAYEEGFEDMRHRKPDLSKVIELIDFKPKYNLEQILKRTIDYFEE
ncbi:MAG: NAD-dependent epimerase/dehydratase family protein, partial [FCB group bacterium]|nr:NAD-dependent epimerase/dehydratase family protein [FCB group bacterium]